jgi:hypothetical protein
MDIAEPGDSHRSSLESDIDVRYYQKLEQAHNLYTTGALDIDKVAVLGAGLAGCNIIAELAFSGIGNIYVYDQSQETLEGLRESVRQKLTALPYEWKLGSVDNAISRIITSTTPEDAMKSVDLVIEVAADMLNVKRELAELVENTCKPTTIFATTTLQFPVNEVADGLQRPQNVIGIRFLDPILLIPHVELTQGARTEKAVWQRVAGWLMERDKIPFPGGSFPGGRTFRTVTKAVPLQEKSAAQLRFRQEEEAAGVSEMKERRSRIRARKTSSMTMINAELEEVAERAEEERKIARVEREKKNEELRQVEMVAKKKVRVEEAQALFRRRFKELMKTGKDLSEAMTEAKAEQEAVLARAEEHAEVEQEEVRSFLSLTFVSHTQPCTSPNKSKSVVFRTNSLMRP